MGIKWEDEAWEEYLDWQIKDKKVLKKINDLIKDIRRNGTKGIGKAEKLKYVDAYSRRIDKKNRLVFTVDGDDIYIISCEGHYDDK